MSGEPNPVAADPAVLALEAHDPPKGQVYAEQKTIPICERPPEYHDSSAWCYLRGHVDVKGFQQKLKSGGDELWDDKTATSTNVALYRPSHDAWGIKKIVFIYCDDFLQRCFELPWLHDPEWRALLDPVFAALNVPVDRVVRCLLASMPPGIAIPPHHDTGYWVMHTHRVHVPIITDLASVAFRVGPTKERMRRVNFREGDIIELNNQSKHAVDNCWNRYRVHLIFDYLEPAFKLERIRLKPGEKLSQTRRSVDLASEKGSRPCPSYLILGAQKCGTTSMYEYLCQHPLVLRAKRRETHYLDWRWNHKLTKDADHLATYHQFFHKPAVHNYPSLQTGESTPSYLLHSDQVIPRVKMLAPQARFIIMLRDPVARAYSQYQMVIDPEGTPEQKAARGTHWVGKSFEQVVDEEMDELAKCGISESTTYDDFARTYLASRPMGYGSHSLLARGLYALQLEPWLRSFPRERFLILFMDDMKTPEGTHDTLEKVFHHLGLPPHRVVDVEAKNTRKYEPLSPDTRERLARFYHPFNLQLYQLMGRTMAWAEPSSN